MSAHNSEVEWLSIPRTELHAHLLVPVLDIPSPAGPFEDEEEDENEPIHGPDARP